MFSDKESLGHSDARAKGGRLALVGILAYLWVGGASAAVTNLVLNPGFQDGTWMWKGAPATTIAQFNVSGGYKNAACIPMTTPKKSSDGNDASKPENLLYQTLSTNGLLINRRYQLSFYAYTSGMYPSGSLMASVTATERMENGIYLANRYTEKTVGPLTRDASTRQQYVMKFTTPVVAPRDAAGKVTRPEVMFQALAKTPPGDDSRICVTDVVLQDLGPNTEVMTPSTPVIRYNQVVAAQENGLSTYFTVINPPIPSTLEMVTGEGASEAVVRSERITATTLDIHTKLPVYSHSTYWTSPAKLRLKDNAGNVVAETETIKFASSSPYSKNAPSLKRDALHFFYAQRAGQDIVDGRYDTYRNQFNRKAGHVNETAACFDGVDNFGNDYSGTCTTAGGKMSAIPVHGGWYDAGDQGKYVVNGAVSLWALQNVIEIKQKKGTLNAEFPQGFLKYGNTSGRSDLLEEARYEMEWLLRMQVKNPLTVRVPVGDKDVAGTVQEDPENVVLTIGKKTYIQPRFKVVLPLSNVNAQGLVFSAVRDADWAGIPTKPEDNKQTRVLDYPTTHATLAFAAVAAQSYRIWKGLDPAFAEECLAAAKVAWAAAEKNPRIYRYGEWSEKAGTYLRAINQGGGAYAGTNKPVGSAKEWAGLELYLATTTAGQADTSESQAFLVKGAPSNFEFIYDKSIESFSWSSPRSMGLLSLLANGRNAEIIAKRTLAGSFASTVTPLESLQTVAQNSVNNIQASAFGVPHTTDAPFNWASNADIGNSGVLLLSAQLYGVSLSPISGTNAARRVMSYLLGNNPLGKSYVTGYGSNPVMNPHHRFWAKHANISMPPAPPGLLVGGPNAVWGGTVVSNASLSAGKWILPTAAGRIYMNSIISTCNALEPPSDNADGSKTIQTVGSGGIGCYQDHFELFMTNEVAINWNAPLFWMASFLN